MDGKTLLSLGIPSGPLVGVAKKAALTALKAGFSEGKVSGMVDAAVRYPDKCVKDSYFGELALQMLEHNEREAKVDEMINQCEPKPWTGWGLAGIQVEAVEQLEKAVTVPSAIRGALMPDGHLGYGLPIGGVLATKNTVIPYAVGVDIACRMKLSVLNTPVDVLKDPAYRDRFVDAIEQGTRFGLGCAYPLDARMYHEVMDDNRWYSTEFLSNLKSIAWEQLGTSGSGNHFVEFGILTIDRPDNGTGQGVGQYVALLSHSGSRRLGAEVCKKYSKIATNSIPEELRWRYKHLAWLDLDTTEGQEYWHAMNLCGDYASANHDVLHKQVAKFADAEIIGGIENHHNFAWKETHFGEEVIVHRKGATPAGDGVFGIIPGSMGTTAFLVKGKGNPKSLSSASHGAGRLMSRTQGKKLFDISKVRKQLAEEGVHVISAGDDEVPGVYKDIHEVMKQQTDLVDKVGRFDPRIVKMSGHGDRPED